MFLVRWLVVLLLGGAHVETAFQAAYLNARLAWGIDKCPHAKEVRWCKDDECVFLHKGPYVAYTFSDGRIIFDHDKYWYDDALQSTMSHEVGHSLGVAHNKYGVMSEKWDWPVMLYPTKEEIDSVGKEYICAANE
jgi:hypothetical protein